MEYIAVEIYERFARAVETFGTETDVQFQANDGNCTSVNFEVADAARAILPANEGADAGAMTIFKPHGPRKIIKWFWSNQDHFENH